MNHLELAISLLCHPAVGLLAFGHCSRHHWLCQQHRLCCSLLRLLPRVSLGAQHQTQVYLAASSKWIQSFGGLLPTPSPPLLSSVKLHGQSHSIPQQATEFMLKAGNTTPTILPIFMGFLPGSMSILPARLPVSGLESVLTTKPTGAHVRPSRTFELQGLEFRG